MASGLGAISCMTGNEFYAHGNWVRLAKFTLREAEDLTAQGPNQGIQAGLEQPGKSQTTDCTDDAPNRTDAHGLTRTLADCIHRCHSTSDFSLHYGIRRRAEGRRHGGQASLARSGEDTSSWMHYGTGGGICTVHGMHKICNAKSQ